MSKHSHCHEQTHHSHDDSPAHIHSHRNIIGFDEHGVPTVILKASHGESEQDDPQAFIKDYMNAVSEYRKTFPSKQDVIEQTPDPAVKEMLLRMEQLGIDTAFDRFDKQKPQCNFGLAGVCCKICNMGPCRITARSPKGVCGADADLIVARNLLRSAAAGAAQHGMHAREVMLALKWAAEGKLDVPILGEQSKRTVSLKMLHVTSQIFCLRIYQGQFLTSIKPFPRVQYLKDRRFGKNLIYFRSVRIMRYLKRTTSQAVQQTVTGVQ